MYKDAFNNVKKEMILAPIVSTAAKTSSACDLAGYEGAMFTVLFGTSADSLSSVRYWDCKLQESDDDVTYTDVAAADVIGNTSNQFGLVNALADDDACYTLGYKGIKRYIKVVVTPTGSHASGTPIAITATKLKSVNPPSNVVNP